MANEAKWEESEFLQHTKEAGKAVLEQWKSLVPKEFWEHRRKARHETLLALRSLVDAAIEHLEESGDKPRGRQSPNRKVKVEVE